MRGLHAQAEALSVPAEIVVLDDVSEAHWQALNAELASLPLVRYEVLPENLGRARIRNRLAELAQYPYLVFMDGDMSLLGADFLEQYLSLARKGVVVACGGHTYDPKRPPKERYLHWHYGMTRETPPASERTRRPHQSFKTSNFLIQREVMLHIRFDERLRHYGHEDTLFGFRLAEANYPITHLDNPLQHDDIETNADFLRKTELGLDNLVRIQRDFDLPTAFADTVLLLRTAQQLRHRKLGWLVALGFRVLRPLLRAWLLLGTAPIAVLNGYKLGYYLMVEERNS